MRIAFLTSQYPAPSHTFIRREIAALRARGLSIDAFSVRRPAATQRLSPQDEAEYASTFYIVAPDPLRLVRALAMQFIKRPLRYLSTLALAFRHRVPGLRAVVYALFYFAEAMYLADELERRRIEHVHNHFANTSATVALLATRQLGLGLSLTLHGISEFDYPAGLLLADKIRAADFVACVSHFGRAQAMRLVEPAQWPKLLLSRCGVELSTLPARAPHGGARVRVVCVARLSPEKGLFGLLQAFAVAVASGQDLELRVAGDGPERARLAAAIRERGLSDRVQLLGALSEAGCLEEIAAADVFAMASFMEGLPVVLMEALALGVPAVAPCVAGIPELIEHGKSGLLYHVGDFDDLARQLERLCGDPALRSELAAEGRRRARDEYAIEHASAPIAARLQRPQEALAAAWDIPAIVPEKPSSRGVSAAPATGSRQGLGP